MSALKQQPPKKAPPTDAGKKVLRAKPRKIDVEAVCDDVIARYPKVLSRLAE
jgi:hypothetical protein